MDTLFVLGQESRQRILRQAASLVPGCAYLCAWAAIPPAAAAAAAGAAQPLPLLHPPPPSTTSGQLLCCLDAWLCDGGGGDGDDDDRRLRALFDAYRGALCAPVAGCVPGWAYKDGRAYMELPARDLATSATLPVQQQFYQEAGIKMAAFMGCESGEIEIGMSSSMAASSGSSPMSLESTLHQVFSEDFFQQSLLEELLQLPPTRPSSPSSSSLPSAVSAGSPAAADHASTSLPRTTTAAAAPSPAVPPPPPLPPPHARRPPVIPFARHGPGGGGGRVCFPSAEADDAAMAQAMLDVISAASSSSPALPATPPPSTAPAAPPPPPPPPRHRARRRTAFRAYDAALAPRAAPWRRPPGAPGQRMIKMGISILRRMHVLRFGRERTAAGGGTSTMPAQRGQEAEDYDTSSPAAPTSSQLNHMISERRRRERLNESFEALRGLLPPGSKKDKATVLAKTLDYMNILVAQIADLEARNRNLESRAQHHHHHHRGYANGGGGSNKEWSSSSPLEQRVVAPQGQMSGTAGTSSSAARVQVHVTAASSAAGGASTSSSSAPAGRPPPPSREVVVHARVAQGDVAELVARALAVIKGMGCFTVVAVDAGRPSDGGSDDVAQATFTLRATAGNFDAASLREAVTKAVEESATPARSDDA